MTDNLESPPPPRRVATGITGLDLVLDGGLFKGGIYIVTGSPGSGKTTFGNQASFHNVASGGRSLYVTLLSETHARMLFQMRAMRFFEPGAVGTSLLYVNGFSAIEAEGLSGLLKLIRRAVRDHHADFIVLDGMVTAGYLAPSGIDYKKFINELQTWVGVIGCTVLFLTSEPADARLQPEHSMVDGIFELRTEVQGMRSERRLTVTKFRGSSFTEGAHSYVITSEGIVVHPRTEARLGRGADAPATEARLSTGVPGLDDLMGGGIPAGSTTLVTGPSGIGKTALGLAFLSRGLAAGERALCVGLCDRPAALVAKAERLGLGARKAIDEGRLTLVWQPAGGRLLDAFAEDLLASVARAGAQRVLVDGLEPLRRIAEPGRLPAFCAALFDELGARGVTTMVTDVGGAPATEFHNLLEARWSDAGGEPRRVLGVVKMRDSAHDLGRHVFEIGQGGIRLVGKHTRGDASET